MDELAAAHDQEIQLPDLAGIAVAEGSRAEKAARLAAVWEAPNRSGCSDPPLTNSSTTGGRSESACSITKPGALAT